MNEYYNDYNRVVFETPAEHEEKRKKQRRLFSRVFIALFLYTLITEVILIAADIGASMMLSPEKYAALRLNTVYQLLISCVAQYLIAFPVLWLILKGSAKSHRSEQTRLSEKGFFLLLLIGETLMYAGSLIGNLLNQLIGNLTGSVPENGIATYVTETPLWLIFILMVVIGPIVEELIFRKLMIDRLSIYGDRVAIFFSAVAFGLMHRNFYQFFYAALLGLLLGYVYASTRNVKYTVLMHMFFNFMGSVVALPAQRIVTECADMLQMLSAGIPIDLVKLFGYGTVTLAYTNLQYGMIIGGIIALVYCVRKKKFSVSSDKEIYIADREIIKNGIVNVGSILFLISCTAAMILSLIFV